jgi:hypothetical protein
MTLEAIAKARQDFKDQEGRLPQTVYLSPEAFKELDKFTSKAKRPHGCFDAITVKIDRELSKDELRLK